jgi:phosphohistidine swiveling domain-containing protein
MTLAWEFDTNPDPRFPLHARVWAAEAMPEVLSPLTSSLVLDEYERSWRRYLVETLPVITSVGTERVFANIFGGRFYVNLSALRLTGDLSQNNSATQMDSAFAAGVSVPPYERPGWFSNLEERRQVMQSFNADLVVNPPTKALAAEFDRVLDLRMEGQRFRNSSDTSQLWKRMDSLRAEFVNLSWRHLTISGLARGLYQRIERKVSELMGPLGLLKLSQIFGNLGLESAAAGKAIRDCRGDPSELNRIIARFGYRAPNEWELASTSWDQDPEGILRALAVGKIEIQPNSSREKVGDLSTELAPEWPEAEFFLNRGCEFLRMREQSKAACLILTNEWRLDSLLIGMRLQKNGVFSDPSDVYLTSFSELETLVTSGKLDVDLPKRRMVMTKLTTIIAPEVIDISCGYDLSDWMDISTESPAKDRTALVFTGVGASAGTATGPARVLRSSSEGFPEMGEILVAHATDPGWTPLMLVASGIVTELGNEFSHAAMVAREFGIPAVVGARGCLEAVRTGRQLEIDGYSGTVRVIG